MRHRSRAAALLLTKASRPVAAVGLLLAKVSRPVAAVGLLLALVGALALTVGAGGYYTDRSGLLLTYVLAWVFFAAAIWVVRGVPPRQAMFLLVAGGIAVTATGLLAPPSTSTDSYRYAWDGRVQAAGFSPYDHAPADPALAWLRDDWLFPSGAACDRPDRYPIPAEPGTCTLINRSTVHTIYPPLGELYFRLVHRLSPEGARHKPLQVGGALLVSATSAALLIGLRRRADTRDRAAAYTAFWAWCPAVPVEAVNNAHIDALSVLLTVVALTVTSRHRLLAGALLGAGTATRLLPAIVLPGALSGTLRTRRRVPDALAVLVPAALVLALSYLPYVLTSRSSVLGYLFGYLNEEGYEDPGSRGRYALLRLVVPDSWTLPVAFALVGIVVLHVLRHGDAERPWHGALVVTGVAFLVFTPGYSWYGLLVVALVALDGRWEWLGVPLAGMASYLGTNLGTAAYALAALAVAGGYVARSRPSPVKETTS